jgi:glyoxylase-like metal-dependent hydrolase (beta-lactamase superfamily II)
LVERRVPKRRASRIKAGLLATALFLVAGCTSEVGLETTAAPTTTSSTTTTTTLFTTLPAPPGPGTEWVGVQYGVEKTYILYKGGKATLVDTGAAGIAPAIGEALLSIGMGWSDVEHIILTQHHDAEIGGLAEVLAFATEATVYVGEGDAGNVPNLPEGRGLQIIRDGDRVFDLTIIETPGPTPGHISVLDQAAGILVDGDLIVVRRGEIHGPTGDSSDRIDQTYDSLRKLSQFDFETILVARGEPVLADGSNVMSLIAGLGP